MACADAIHNNAAVLIDMARRAPSEYIRTHVEGGGNGFELDDLLSRYWGRERGADAYGLSLGSAGRARVKQIAILPCSRFRRAYPKRLA